MNKTLQTMLLVGLASSAWAVPSLQLDVTGSHHYDAATQTIIADHNPFSVRALIDHEANQLNENGANGLTRTYHLSAAITPNSGAGFGSFDLLGTTYNSGNMQYGVPPVDSHVGDLPGHGIFPTYYVEISFTINQLQSMGAYNTADGSTQAGNSLFFVDFLVNVAGLATGSSVHFDLYAYDHNGNRNENRNQDWKLDDFAPFSHDAQSGTHGIIIGTPAPDGGTTLLLLGSALTGLGLLRRKFGVKVG